MSTQVAKCRDSDDETGVAYLRNSLPSPCGRLSALLLDCALSKHIGGSNVSINPSLFLLRLSTASSVTLTLPASIT